MPGYSPHMTMKSPCWSVGAGLGGLRSPLCLCLVVVPSLGASVLETESYRGRGASSCHRRCFRAGSANPSVGSELGALLGRDRPLTGRGLRQDPSRLLCGTLETLSPGHSSAALFPISLPLKPPQLWDQGRTPSLQPPPCTFTDFHSCGLGR